MNTTTIILLLAALVLVAGALMIYQRQRSQKLRKRFGPEYDHTVQETGNRRQAEQELAARQKRVEAFNIRPLSPEERNHFADTWQSIQARFVDEPPTAVQDADRLVEELMETRGYPAGDFEQRAADISVDHPATVAHYRTAREISLKNHDHDVDTEELRQAFVHDRALFEELLETDQPPVESAKEVV